MDIEYSDKGRRFTRLYRHPMNVPLSLAVAPWGRVGRSCPSGVFPPLVSITSFTLPVLRPDNQGPIHVLQRTLAF